MNDTNGFLAMSVWLFMMISRDTARFRPYGFDKRTPTSQYQAFADRVK